MYCVLNPTSSYLRLFYRVLIKVIIIIIIIIIKPFVEGNTMSPGNT